LDVPGLILCSQLKVNRTSAAGCAEPAMPRKADETVAPNAHVTRAGFVVVKVRKVIPFLQACQPIRLGFALAWRAGLPG
jgi:hypothetical protein